MSVKLSGKKGKKTLLTHGDYVCVRSQRGTAVTSCKHNLVLQMALCTQHVHFDFQTAMLT